MRHLCALLVAIATLVGPSHAEEWPNKAVRIIVPFGAGGLGDLLARLSADHLASAFKVPFVVENRTGAGGMLGAQQGANADPDGYTLTLTNVSTLSLVPATNAQTPYDALKDFTHIAYIGGAPASLAVFPGIGAKTIREFIAHAKTASNPVTFGSTGFGSDGQIVGEAMGRSLGIKVQHVPYRGAPQAMADLIAGHLAFLPFTIGQTGETIKQGKITGLAVSSPQRMASLPDVPTFKELGYPELVTLTWFSLSGPAKLPQTIAEALNREIAVMLKKPETVAKFNQLGIVTEPMSTDEFTAFVAAEIGPLEAHDRSGRSLGQGAVNHLTFSSSCSYNPEEDPCAMTSSPAISNSCDCHFHVMGPPDRYEFRRNHVYNFEPAPLSEYLKAVTSLGIVRYVLVQPSIYELDNRCLLDFLEQLPAGSARGIVAIGEGASLSELKSMHERGVRGVRFNMVQGPEHDLDFIGRIARKITDLGWHLEVYVKGSRLAPLRSKLDKMPVPVVVDHMGQIALGASDEQEQISSLRCLLDSGNVWVKLIGYRLSVTGFPYDDADGLATLLASQYTSRCLWGSDWPYSNFKGRTPTPDQLHSGLMRWATSEHERAAILVHNPAEIYGLGQSHLRGF